MRRHLPFLLGPLLLLPLLVTLAVLQYRWVGELTRKEEEGARTALRAGLDGFSHAFDREIGLAYWRLQIDPTSLASGDLADFSAQYRRWTAESRAPQIVRGVYAVVWSDGQVTLRRYDQERGAFVLSEWPLYLAAIRTRLNGERARSTTAMTWSDSQVPAIVAPMVDIGRLQRQAAVDLSSIVREARSELLHPRGMMVLVFDAAAIQRDLLPALLVQHLPAGYRYTVCSAADPRQVIASSAGYAALTAATAEARNELFAIRLDDMPIVSHMQQGVGAIRGVTAESRSEIFAVRPEHMPVVLDTHKGGGGTRGVTVTVSGARNRRTVMPAAWIVLAARRGDSLGATIARTRQRNLAISFSILGLLAVAMALIVIHARRAAALAEQQLDFVTGISHELRTPLTIVAAAADNLAAGIVAAPLRVQEYGRLIEEQTRRLTAMVEHVLEFARSAPGVAQYRFEPLEVEELVRSAVAGAASYLREQRFDVQTTIAPSAGEILADAGSLVRAIDNLIRNAVKYGREERTIAICAAGDTARVRLSVADRGRGIAAGELPRIFEPFYRASDVVEAQLPGSGLGLTIVRRIVEGHGGRVTVESRVGEGSVFTIDLPRRAA